MNILDLKTQIEDVNALGRQNLTEKGVTIPENATTYEIMTAIAEISGVGDVEGGGVTYTNIVYNEDNTITLTDKDGVEHIMSCTYEDGKLIGVTYDGKKVKLTYDGDVLVKVGKTAVDVENAPSTPSGTSLNIAYGDTAPEDTSKLWIRANEPDKITFKKEVEGAESVSLLDTYLPRNEYNYVESAMGCASVGTKIYLFGGYDSSFRSNRIFMFDTETETITILSTTLPSKREGVSCVSIGTKIYLFGGKTTHSTTGFLSEICVFDTETETITTLSATLPKQCSDISCARVGTKIYLFGGREYNSTYKDISVFNTETETLTTLSKKLPDGRAGMGCASIGTKVYLFGGYEAYNNTKYDTIFTFDTKIETITTLSTTLPIISSSMGCSIIGTKIYLLGGRDKSVNFDTITVFDTESKTITTLDTVLPYQIAQMGCASVGTKVYLFGGNMSVYGIDNSNSITKFTLTSPLSQGNIELQTSFLNNVFKLINTDTAQVEMGVENVYIGNENNEAELCEAYLHNGIEWAVIE